MTLDNLVRKSRNFIGGATLGVASLLASPGCSIISDFDKFTFISPDGSTDGQIPDSSIPDTYRPDSTYDTGRYDSGRDAGYDTSIVDSAVDAGVDTGVDSGYDAGYDTGIVDSAVDAGAEIDAGLPDGNYDANTDADTNDADADLDTGVDTLDAMLDSGADADATDSGVSDAGDAGPERYTRPYTPDTACVALYHFDNPTPLEDSCRTNDLTAMGTTVSMGRTADFRDARQFNGVDESLSAPDSADLNLTNGLTVEAYVRLESYPTASPLSYIAGRNDGTTGGQQWLLGIDNMGRLAGSRMTADCTSDDGEGIISMSSVPLHTWTHVAYTYNPMTNVQRLYINSTLERESMPTRAGICTDATAPLTIGMDGLGRQPFYGDIDELRILDEARQPQP